MHMVCLSAPVTKVRVDAIVCVSFYEVHYSEGGRVVLCGVVLDDEPY